MNNNQDFNNNINVYTISSNTYKKSKVKQQAKLIKVLGAGILLLSGVIIGGQINKSEEIVKDTTSVEAELKQATSKEVIPSKTEVVRRSYSEYPLMNNPKVRKLVENDESGITYRYIQIIDKETQDTLITFGDEVVSESLTMGLGVIKNTCTAFEKGYSQEQIKEALVATTRDKIKGQPDGVIDIIATLSGAGFATGVGECNSLQ